MKYTQKKTAREDYLPFLAEGDITLEEYNNQDTSIAVQFHNQDLIQRSFDGRRDHFLRGE